MKKILVPTDFSATARCAMAYAQHLASELDDAHLDIVHMYLPATAAEYPNIVPPIAEFLDAREKMLLEFVAQSKESCAGKVKEDLPITTHLLIGFPADEIVRLSSNYDLIVMGTTGESDLLDNLFGSVSSHVARKSKCPVILVPKGVEFKPLAQILYASNYESADPDVIRAVMAFNEPFKAKLHFVHVRSERETVPFSQTKEDIFSDLFAVGEPVFAFEMEEIEGNDAAEAINDFAEEKSIDLVVMVARKRSFWDGFFHRSQTRSMALNTKLPLMVFHLE